MNKEVQEFEKFVDEMEGAILASILTVNEVCVMWGKNRRTVEMAIWRDKLKARQAQTGRFYLISRASCVELWGAPVIAFEDVK